MKMGKIKADTAKLTCNRGQGSSEQPFHGSWALVVAIPASSLGAGPLPQGVVLGGGYTQPDVFPDRPLPDVHRGSFISCRYQFIFCLPPCSMPGSPVVGTLVRL